MKEIDVVKLIQAGNLPIEIIDEDIIAKWGIKVGSKTPFTELVITGK